MPYVDYFDNKILTNPLWHLLKVKKSIFKARNILIRYLYKRVIKTNKISPTNAIEGYTSKDVSLD